jgi:hypothetical protein
LVRGDDAITRESSLGVFRCFAASAIPVPGSRTTRSVSRRRIDGDPGRPSRNIFVGSKAPWHEIDTLPQLRWPRR